MVVFDVWHMPLHYAMVALSIGMAYRAKAPLYMRVALLYVLVQTSYIGFHPNYESPLIPMVSDYVRLGALQVWIMVLAYALLLTEGWFGKYFSYFACAFVVGDALWLFLANAPWLNVNDRYSNAGMMTASTQSVAMWTCFIPMFLQNKYLRFLCIPILALMIYFKAATAAVVLSAITLVYLWHWRKGVASLVFLLGVVAAYLVKRFTDFLNPGARLELWRVYINFWDHSERYAFGLGFGSWDSFSRFITIPDDAHQRAYFLFHNDWLQALVTGGFVGLAILLWFYVATLMRAKKTWVRASIFGFGMMMCFYSPLEFAIGQLFAVFLIRESSK